MFVIIYFAIGQIITCLFFIFHFRHILFLEGAGVKATVKVSGTKVCPVLFSASKGTWAQECLHWPWPGTAGAI